MTEEKITFKEAYEKEVLLHNKEIKDFICLENKVISELSVKKKIQLGCVLKFFPK